MHPLAKRAVDCILYFGKPNYDATLDAFLVMLYIVGPPG